MIRLTNYLWVAVICLLFTSCNDSSGNDDDNVTDDPIATNTTIPQFTSLPSTETGIDFSNDIEETNELSYYTYEYIYNGGGVAIGDINNDDLPDIYFTSTLLSNKLYLNKGNLQFEDITESAGVGSTGFKTGVTMIDINADGYLDIYVCRTGKGDVTSRSNLLYINNGDLTFTESAAAYGLDDQSNSNHATFFDYDKDGDLDMYLVNHPIDFNKSNGKPRVKPVGNQYVRITTPTTPHESDRLYKNNGNGSFTNVSASAGINNRAFGLSVAINDFNNDGYDDIYVANDFIEPDFVYINNKNGTFTDKGFEYFRHQSQHSMGSNVQDINNDGLMDLIALDMQPESNYRQKTLFTTMRLNQYNTLLQFGYGHQIMRNMFQLNNGNGTFSEIACLSGIEKTDWSWAPLVVDFDNDGWKDVYITNGYKRDVTNLDFIAYRQQIGGANNSVKVTDVHEILNEIPTTKVQNYMYKNNGDLTFSNNSNTWGFTANTFSNGAAYADLDNDGDLDIIVNNIDDKALVYKNNADELETNNTLRVTLKGSAKNPIGIGTRVKVFVGDNEQVIDMRTNVGFFSSVESVLHFGLGDKTTVDRVEIIWQDGKAEVLENIEAGEITADYANAASNVSLHQDKKTTPIFTDITNSAGAVFVHRENPYDDFQREPMIPNRLSQEGPALDIADVNADGLEDFYVGGASGSMGALYLQTTSGKFRNSPQSAFQTDAINEDVDAHFFDADGDNDLDLYVVSGGYAFEANSSNYQDRLYLNDGNGSFTKSADIPQMLTSGSVAISIDYDADGDNDLFVGGRAVPNMYPTAPKSYILENNGGVFTDATQSVSPYISTVGMITDANVADINKDGKNDLIVIGEWMSPKVFINADNKLVTQVTNNGLGKYTGWYNCVEAADIDNDGDIDLICGNAGLNTRYNPDLGKTLKIHAKDFDYNGKLDAVMSQVTNGQRWVVQRRQMLLSNIPTLQKKFITYDMYATTPFTQMFTSTDLQDAIQLEAAEFRTSYFVNDGSGNFTINYFDNIAQISPTYGIATDDFNNDGKLDIVTVGNNFAPETEGGRYDAGNGLLLTGSTDSNYKAINLLESGLFAPGNARDVKTINLANGKKAILIANNGAILQVVEYN